ncbi:MAG: carbamoyl-phosphate synthase large subunit, partial [Alphaproteobacteria bacterium]|nr:carbamoyl-phosphate synthase large subunit [Alphaproteobacteria bacterium]
MAVIRTLFIANRGEIAVRIARSAAEMGISTVAAYARDEADSLHVRLAERKVALPEAGPKAYLDIAAVIAAARGSGCDGLHPGYGFLAENSALAAACADAGLTFVGPTADMLALFGDKARARTLAQEAHVPVLRGTGPVSPQEAEAFLDSLGPGGAIMLKAVAGGGGRGMRPVRARAELAEAYARCASEAKAAFGDPALYAEEFLPHARHIEVQIAGDGTDLVHLGDRECSLQRQRQKLIEIAPALGLGTALRAQILDAAVRLGRAARYSNLGTIEFLVQADQERFAFIEANARLQVEHTVTEEVMGLDLVRLQLEIASGRRLHELGLHAPERVSPSGIALQVRINMESMQPDGTARPESGVITRYEPAAGPGVRVDGMGYTGYHTSTRYDALLAKLIVHCSSGKFEDVIAKALRALREFTIEGVTTNMPFLRALLAHPMVRDLNINTQFVDTHMGALLAAVPQETPPSSTDPLAVLFAEQSQQAHIRTAPVGTTAISAPLQGSVVVLSAERDAAVFKGQTVLVLEAMKMEHPVLAPASGYLRGVLVEPGQTVFQGDLLAYIEEAELADVGASTADETDLDRIRPDLEELFTRKELTQDAARPQAVARRRQSGQRTARENIEDLCDPDSFTEYGSLVIAGQLRRRPMRELIEKTPADGLVCGLGRVNGQYFDDARSRVIAMSYDYTVLAGTQGMRNH